MHDALFSLEAFAGWLEKQPPDEKYDYWCGDCAIGQYLKAADRNPALIGTGTWTDGKGACYRLPAHWNDISFKHPRTFGAAAARARAAQRAPLKTAE